MTLIQALRQLRREYALASKRQRMVKLSNRRDAMRDEILSLKRQVLELERPLPPLQGLTVNPTGFEVDR